MPVPVEHTPSGAWLVHDPHYETHTQSRTIAYARVSTSSQKDDLQRQADRLKAFAINLGVESPQVITEITSGMTEVLTSYCARFYGRRAAKNKAKRAMEAMQDD